MAVGPKWQTSRVVTGSTRVVRDRGFCRICTRKGLVEWNDDAPSCVTVRRTPRSPRYWQSVSGSVQCTAARHTGNHHCGTAATTAGLTRSPGATRIAGPALPTNQRAAQSTVGPEAPAAYEPIGWTRTRLELQCPGGHRVSLTRPFSGDLFPTIENGFRVL